MPWAPLGNPRTKKRSNKCNCLDGIWCTYTQPSVRVAGLGAGLKFFTEKAPGGLSAGSGRFWGEFLAGGAGGVGSRSDLLILGAIWRCRLFLLLRATAIGKEAHWGLRRGGASEVVDRAAERLAHRGETAKAEDDHEDHDEKD